MKPDLAFLQITRLIVHDVPKRLASTMSDELELSEVESQLDTALQNYLRERISDSLSRSGGEVSFDTSSTSPVPTLIADCLANADFDFVTTSSGMARHLYVSQTGVNPEGLLVVAMATLMDVSALAIMKLERESGIRAQVTQVGGLRTFALAHIKELLLTRRTRVFKVGLFWRFGEEICGLVSDEQVQRRGSRDIADFFLRRFLGCQLSVQPDVRTRDFFHACQEFINARIDSSELKARYHVALLAEMSSTRAQLDPRQFVEDHLEPGDRASLLSHLENCGIAPSNFQKDTHLIESRLKRIEIDFESGIAVIAPPETVGDQITMSDLQDGRTRVQIEDTVRELKGKR